MAEETKVYKVTVTDEQGFIDIGNRRLRKGDLVDLTEGQAGAYLGRNVELADDDDKKTRSGKDRKTHDPSEQTVEEREALAKVEAQQDQAAAAKPDTKASTK